MSETSVDLDRCHQQIMSAVKAIADGKRDPTAHATIRGGYGSTESIEKCLGNGSAFRGEVFNDDHMDVVAAAFAQFGATPPSKRVGECCAELLRLLTKGRGEV